MSTIFDADRDGMIAALSSRTSARDIPPAYAKSPVLRDAWSSAFEKTRESLRGTPVEAERGARVEPTEGRKTRKPKESAQEARKPRAMADILAEQHSEYA